MYQTKYVRMYARMEANSGCSNPTSQTAILLPSAFPSNPYLCNQSIIHTFTPLLSPCRCANPFHEEWMLQRIRGRDPLFGVDSQATVQEVMEKIEVPGLGLVHAAGCDHEARAEVPRWLDHGQNSDGCLQVQNLVSTENTISSQWVILQSDERIW